MRHRMASWLLVGWLLGVGTGLIGLAATTGWYEYRIEQGPVVRTMVNSQGWELMPGYGDTGYLRRPRLRLP